MRWKALQHVWKLKFRVDRSRKSEGKNLVCSLPLFHCFSFISVQMKMDVHSGFDSSLPNKVTVKKPSALKVQKIRSVCAFYFLQWGYSLFAPALISELEGVCLRPLIHSISIRITMKENSERSSEEKMSRRIFRVRKGVEKM